MEKIGSVYYPKGTKPKILKFGQVTKPPGIGIVTIDGVKYYVGSQYVPQPGETKQAPQTIEWAPKYTFIPASQKTFKKEEALAEIKKHEPKMMLPVLETPKGPTAQIKPQPPTFFESIAKAAQESEAVKWSPKKPVSIAPAIFGKVGQWASLQVAGAGMAAEKEIRELSINPARYGVKLADPLLLHKTIYSVGKEQYKFARAEPVEFVGQTALGLLVGKFAGKPAVTRAKLVSPEKFWKPSKLGIKMTTDLRKAEWVDFGTRSLSVKKIVAAAPRGTRHFSAFEIQMLKEKGLIIIGKERPRQVDVGLVIRPKEKIKFTYTPEQITSIMTAIERGKVTEKTRPASLIKPKEVVSGKTKLLIRQKQAYSQRSRVTELDARLIYRQVSGKSLLSKSIFGGSELAETSALRRTIFTRPKKATLKQVLNVKQAQAFRQTQAQAFRLSGEQAQAQAFKQTQAQAFKQTQAQAFRQAAALKMRLRMATAMSKTEAYRSKLVMRKTFQTGPKISLLFPRFKMELTPPKKPVNKSDIFGGTRTRYNPSLAGVVSGKRLKEEPTGILTGIGVRYPSMSIKKLI